MKNKLILIARAYNDLDSRISLLNQYADLKEKNHEIHVVLIPTNKGYANFVTPQIKKELKRIGVNIKSIYEFNAKKKLILKLIKLYWLIPKKTKNRLARRFFVMIKNSLFKLIHKIYISDKKMIKDFILFCKGSYVIVDEVIFFSNRSFIITKLLENRSMFKIFSFHTGQDPYLNLWHDVKNNSKDEIKIYDDIPFFVPGENDKRIFVNKNKSINIKVTGNSRFDSAWVNRLSGLSKKIIKNNSILSENFQNKVLFMLSKIEYGVDLENILSIISLCSNLKNTRVIIKPHTRGMSINSLNTNLNKNVIDGTKIESSTLIEWSDTVLFTGSSIIFQAMMLHRKIIFLKYCQKYDTIFDDFENICVAKNSSDAIEYLKNYSLSDNDKIGLTQFVNINAQNKIPDGKVCEEIIKEIVK